MLDKICHNNVSKQLSSKDRKSAGARTKTTHGRRLRRLVLRGPWQVLLPGERSPWWCVCPELIGVTPVGSRMGWKQWTEMLGHAVLSWAYRVRCSWDAANQKTWPSAPRQSHSIWPLPKRWHDLGGGQVIPERLNWELSAYSQHPQHLWEWELQSRARRVVLETYRYFSSILWITFFFLKCSFSSI